MTRKIDPERQALRLLKRQAEDRVPGAAAEYADALRRRRKDDELQQRRAQAMLDKQANERSRETKIVGPSHPDWYAPAVLEWLQSPPDTPCAERIEDELERCRIEAEAEDPVARAHHISTFNDKEQAA